MNVMLMGESGIILTNSSPGTRAFPVTSFLPHDIRTETNESLVAPGANLSTNHNATLSPTVPYDPFGGRTAWQVVIIMLLCGSLSLVTIIGNILVLLSFKVNKQLKTVNNYYLLSLAFADLIIGILSMNLYTTYIIMDTWTLGNWACDLWLAVDYVASNASVMNLLVISFDRYFSVTRPLTYRAKRTTKRAMMMIGLAWSISFVLWAPAILFWQYLVGERTVPPSQCYIQFLFEPIITFCTAIAAFYLPVTIMTVLYWRIYKETENRSKELAELKGSGNRGGQEESAAATTQTGSREMGGQRNSGKKKPRRFRFWPPCRRGAWRRAGDANRSSGDSWNNNEMNVSMDQSDEDEEDDGEEPGAIFSVVVSTPGTKGHRDSDDDVGPSRKGFPKTLKDESTGALSKHKHKTQANKRKKMSLVKEKKAAQTLSAILLAFIITWTPYNIMVLVNTFCTDCIPQTLWALGYWLCYVNSTVNPMCYALCNKTFRSTFKSILVCQWDQKNQQREAAVAYRKKTDV